MVDGNIMSFQDLWCLHSVPRSFEFWYWQLRYAIGTQFPDPLSSSLTLLNTFWPPVWWRSPYPPFICTYLLPMTLSQLDRLISGGRTFPILGKSKERTVSFPLSPPWFWIGIGLYNSSSYIEYTIPHRDWLVFTPILTQCVLDAPLNLALFGTWSGPVLSSVHTGRQWPAPWVTYVARSYHWTCWPLTVELLGEYREGQIYQALPYLTLFYARREILLRWKSEELPMRASWWKTINSVSPLYKIMYESRNCLKKFDKIWSNWIDACG